MALYRETSIGQETIERTALRRALDRTLTSPLAIVVAQAGAGKTTLLRQWCGAQTEVNVVFLDVGASDDDPGHFLRRMVSQLVNADATTPEERRIIVPFSDFPPTEWADLVARALELTPETVIVVDNMHRFSNRELVELLGRLIAQAPAQAHFVLSSRVDPPFALSPYRLRDQLLEIRQDDLSFSLDEATELLELLVGHTLPTSQTKALWSRTEGWAAGLQLAGLSLRNHPDPEGFVTAFRGSDRLVADYLGEEVLSVVSPERRRMLLRLGVMDDMCAQMVEAVTGSTDGQDLLDSLERESMFLVPLDVQGEWFRFHHLFSDLLRARMRAEDPAGELKLLTACADWNLAQGRVKAAMQYLLRAQARDGALEAMLADVAETAAHAPTPITSAYERDLSTRASARVRAEVLAGARQVVLGSDSASPDRPRPGLGYVAAQVLWRARPEVSPESARRRLSEIESELSRKPTNTITRAESSELAEVLVSGGRANFLAGNVTEARKWLARAKATASADVVERIAATSALSLVEAWSGNIARANALVTETVETARAAEMLALPSISDAYLASVLTALEDDAPDERAHAASTYSEPTTPRAGQLGTGQLGAAQLGADRLTAGAPPPHNADRGMSRGDVSGLDPVSGTAPEAPSHASGPATAGAGHTSGGEPTSGGSQVGGAPTSSVAPTALFDRAIVSLEAGDTYPVRKIVSAWNQLVLAPRPLAVVQHQILLAWLADLDQAPDDVQHHLAEALRVAEIHGIVDVFIRAGPTIVNRLSSVTGQSSAFSETIATRARQAARHGTAMALPEPLTDRELEILSYLPTRLSNVELAQRFFVSVNTIKTHIAHIYRKLDVPDRNTAIVRARELGLL